MIHRALRPTLALAALVSACSAGPTDADDSSYAVAGQAGQRDDGEVGGAGGDEMQTAAGGQPGGESGTTEQGGGNAGGATPEGGRAGGEENTGGTTNTGGSTNTGGTTNAGGSTNTGGGAIPTDRPLPGDFPAKGDRIELRRGAEVVKTYTSLQEAIDAAQAGDVVRLRGGRYFQPVLIDNRSGTADKPIVVEGAPGERVVLDGAHEGAARGGSGLWMSRGNGVYTAAIPYRGGDARETWASTADEKLLWAYSTLVEFNAFVNGPGTFRDTRGSVWVKLKDNANPDTSGVYVSTAEAAIHIRGASKHWQFRNFEIWHGGRAGIYIEGGTFENVTVDNLLIVTAKHGVATGDWTDPHGTGVVVKNTTVRNNWDRTWWWNFFYGPGAGAMRGAGLFVHANKVELASNVVVGQHDGISASGSDVSVHHNLVHDIHDDGAELESGRSQNVRFFENTIYDAYVGVSAGSDSPGPVYIYRNTIIADRLVPRNSANRTYEYNTAFKTGEFDWAPSEDVKFYHNTIYSSRLAIADWAGSGNNGVEGWEWLNNIFYCVGINNDSGSVSGSIVLNTGRASMGVRFDGNLYHRERSGGLFGNWNGTGSKATLVLARQAYNGWEAAGKQGNPNFVDVNAKPIRDLHLKAGSPARDAGIALPASWPDSVTVTDGKRDIGRYEH